MNIFIDVNSNNFIVLNGDNIVIGHIVLEIKNRSAEYHVVIGNKKFIGRGYGTLMNLKAVDLAFKKYKLDRIFLKVRPENLRAIKSYEKVGFKRIGKRKYKNSNMSELIIMEIRNKK
jgi:RimJ/RimL family protein N-acetyltransferase